MTKRIQEPVMDPYEFIDDGYSRLDHMDGLGMRPGMIRGPLTGLPIPAPEPVPARNDDSIKPGLIATAWLVAAVTILGSIAMVVAAFANGVLR